MKIFAIADLHLDGGENKPMDIFGPAWENHRERIFGAWREYVGGGDAVLIPGDISWAMHLPGALPDLFALAELPGKKVLLRGNHDYWWSSPTRLRSILPEDMLIVQNDACDIGPAIVCGSRGWLLPSDQDFSSDDRRIYERELIRLGLSLAAAKRLRDKCAEEAGEDKPVICMMHYPPMLHEGAGTGFTALLEEYGVKYCLYGHLHGSLGWEAGFRGEKNGVSYSLCSADSLGFSPLLVCEPNEDDSSAYTDGE